jgi:GNAT superfamily N-acetyltransferase
MNRAIEIFARAAAFTRSFAYPAVAERIGKLWVIRDEPRKRPGDYRREEWVAFGTAPAQVDSIARRHARGHFCICAIHGAGDQGHSLRAQYRALRYRLNATEAFMTHQLTRIPKVPEPFPIQRVMTEESADRLAKAAGRRQILPEHFHPDSALRQYVALHKQTPIGWARSIRVGDATWVSNMHVHPAYRRRGIGRSILARMLRDDRSHGSTLSVLLASHAGALLYPEVGYDRIGELLIYTPIRKSVGR